VDFELEKMISCELSIRIFENVPPFIVILLLLMIFNVLTIESIQMIFTFMVFSIFNALILASLNEGLVV